MTKRMVLFLALLPATAVAGPPVNFGGEGTIFFNDCGLWNDPETEAGVVLNQEFPPDDNSVVPQDVSYNGSASNRIVVRWTEDGVPMEAVADTVTGECDWDVQVLGAGSFRGVNSGLVMRKGEASARGINGSGSTFRWWLRSYAIGFEFENLGDSTITDLRVFHASDPELDEALNGDEATVNDLYDSNGWGFDNWAIAEGNVTNITMGYYACEAEDRVGFLQPGADVDGPFVDPDGMAEDLELAWQSQSVSVLPGGSRFVSFSFLAGAGSDRARDWGAEPFSGTTLADHYSIFRGPGAGCRDLDQDDDGVMTSSVGGLDCNDDDATIGAAAQYWRDSDNDGFGDPNNAFSSCSVPSSAVVAGGEPDCNDGDGAINPNADEVCDGIDNDCNDETDDNLPLNTFYADTDMDGFGDPNASEETCADVLAGHVDNMDDCDDSTGSINPSASEIAGNTVDEDCDDSWDCFVDGDGDTFGTSVVVASDDAVCTDDGEAVNSGDCDDTDASINPNATEIAGNSVDEDCDASWDCFVDGDGDTFGVSETVPSGDDSCSDDGESANALDCNDDDASINPAASEIAGNSVDEDCDVSWDCFVDGDGDTFGSDGIVASDDAVCTDDGESVSSDDCDDGNSSVNPDATEIAGNNVDENCDDSWDCFVDGDGDDYGVSDIVASADDSCFDDGESDNALDCDDTDASINPDGMDVAGAAVDANCDGLLTCYIDEDGDGFGNASGGTWMVDGDTCDDVESASSVAGDCNDSDPNVFPGASEIAGNDVDEDCNSEWDCFADDDGDGFASEDPDVVVSDDADCDDDGESAELGDCDDTDASISPDGTDVVGSGVDADCDGFISCFVDLDGDGFGDPDADPVLTDAAACEDADDASSVGMDCDDTDANINPDADEIEDNDVDEDCDGIASLSDDPDTELDTDMDSDSLEDGFVQGGCGCDSGGQNAGWLVLGLLPLALRRRRK